LWDKDQVLGLLACMHACMQCSRIDVRDATGTTLWHHAVNSLILQRLTINNPIPKYCGCVFVSER
jgi:hypothetical protein